MKTSFLTLLITVASAAVLASCTAGESGDRQLENDLLPPSRVTMLPPPVTPDMKDMHPALRVAQARGLKTNVYFSEEIQQSIARLQGMEETLSRLQNDLQGTAMAMQRVEMMRQEVEALNMRFQGLMERMVYAAPPEMGIEGAPKVAVVETALPPVHMVVDTMVKEETTTVTPAVAPVEATAKPAPLVKPIVDEKKPVAAKVTEKSAPVATGPGVQGVRVGEHPDRTRIVLDIAGPAKFNTNLDNGEKLLTVELPETAWKATEKQTFKSSAVASYTAQSSGKGSLAVFALAKDTKILESKLLKGEGNKPSRLMIDLAK